jgi:dienelactone hydrolase
LNIVQLSRRNKEKPFMRRHLINAIACSLVFTTGFSVAYAEKAPAAQAEKAPAEQALMFDYAKSASVPAIAGGVLRKARCCDVTEWKLTVPAVSGSSEIELTVIAPLAKGKHPTVLWLHREGAEVKRAMFVAEAETLAAAGIASLLVELPFKRPYVHRADNNVGDADVIRNAVIDARRAIDWAATRPEFNVEKLAVVGHRYGAWAAALLTGVDKRVDAALLMSPPGKPSGWLQVTEQPRAKAFREGFDKAQWGAYLNSIAPLDPEKWVGYAAPAKVHFQFASSDAWVQTLEQVDLFRAASQPKSRQMFESDELLNDEAKKDRQAWLKRVLINK